MNKHFQTLKNLKLNTKITLVILAFTFIPILIFSTILFMNQKQTVVEESQSYMVYKMSRESDQITTDVDSINMSTRFFRTHDGLLSLLNVAVDDKTPDVRTTLEFYNSEVSELERLVNNNPLLYGVRVYSVTDSVQEMMPVFYNRSRMEKLDWYSEDVEGWHFGYKDKIFSSLITNQDDEIASLVTPMEDYKRGRVGYIEAAIKMKTLFPSLYETIDGEYGFYESEDGIIYTGNALLIEAESLKNSMSGLNPVFSNDIGDIYYLEYDNKYFTIAVQEIKGFGGRLYDVQDITDSIKEVNNRRNLFVVVMTLMVLLSAVGIDRIVRAMFKQFYGILDGIHRVQKGDLSVRVDDSGNDEMGELGSQLNEMLARIQELMELNIQREVLVKNSEIRSLQNQINAHFIYNVLESIKMMAEIDEKYEIADAITSLGKLLRYSMRWISGNVSLAEEIEYIKNYLLLMNLRYDFAVILSMDIPEELFDQEIPKMSLQPIVENSVLHGIEPVACDTTIYIKARVEENLCKIEITDSGKGMSEQALEKLRAKIAGRVQPEGGSAKRHGIGLKNVQDRIQLSFGKDYGVQVFSEEGKYTKVSLSLPRRVSERKNVVK
ncbi:MAG: sensor histidine kinase [Pseudobutyrivibrio sp.]|nr:sensor histidine kinase [Pseudobutyrivibrio sp.]